MDCIVCLYLPVLILFVLLALRSSFLLLVLIYGRSCVWILHVFGRAAYCCRCVELAGKGCILVDRLENTSTMVIFIDLL